MINIKFSRSTVSPANAIIIMDCLGAKDMQTGWRLEEEIVDFLNLLNLSDVRLDDGVTRVFWFDCDSKEKFLEKIKLLTSVCANGVYPLIFIDGHGDKERGLAFPPVEHLSWKDLIPLLRDLCAAAKGELTVVGAFCYSFELVKYFDKLLRPPVPFYYGYEDVISAGEVEDETKLFYKNLIGDGGKNILSPSLKLKLYSEYDHVHEVMILAYLYNVDASVLSSVMPNLSKSKLRKEIGRYLAKQGFQLAGLNQKLQELSPILLEKILNDFMWPTSRRERLLREINSNIALRNLINDRK